MDHRVQKVIALMKKDLGGDLSVDKLAQHVNLSFSRLHQIFKRETGVSPARYIRLLRMHKVKELLETTFLSVKEIMAQVGATDKSHFLRDFKRTHGGLTPSQFRARHLAANRAKDGVVPQARLALASSPVTPFATPGRLSAPTAASNLAATPLLARRSSHPQQFITDISPLRRTSKLKRLKGLFALLVVRHLAFAEITIEITDKIAQKMLDGRFVLGRARPCQPILRQLMSAARSQQALSSQIRPAAPRSTAAVEQPPSAHTFFRSATPRRHRPQRDVQTRPKLGLSSSPTAPKVSPQSTRQAR